MIHLHQVQPIRNGQVLHSPVDLECDAGEIVCIMGTSGVGKTTLLDAIRGDANYHGTIQRPDNFFNVFQGDNQLFPWYTVDKNFALVGAENWQSTAEAWNIGNLSHKKPNDLSGGQRQRFVLLRALSMKADVLLCDEPLNHLDSLGSKIIAQDFRATIQGSNTSVLWITHDIVEAQILADRCYILTKHGLEFIPKNKLDIDYVSKFLVQ